MTLIVIKTFSGDDINKLNQDLWRTIYTKGNELHFGGVDEPKNAREIFAVIQLYGKALQDLYEGKLPKGWKFGEAANKVYIEMLKDANKGEQPYTYGERLHAYPADPQSEYVYDQMFEARCALIKAIEDKIQTNRICGVLWSPADIRLHDPPCFNWFQLRLSESNKVSLRILFRSNDAANAVFANMGAVIRVFVDEVIKPAGGELEEVIWTATSEHICLTDFDQVEALIGKVPEYMRRFLK